MGARTYVPALLAILHRVCKYIVRYNAQIKANVPPEAAAVVDNIVTACNVFTALVPDPIIGD